MSATAKLALAAGVIVAAGAAGYGIWHRHASVAALQEQADDTAIERVQAIRPQPGPKEESFTLPGEVAAWNEAQVYGQVSGYVQAWHKDYGAPVKKGDLLAVIDAPSLDAQFQAAKASLNVAQANYNLSKLTASRFQALSGSAAVTQQEIDNKVAAAEAEKAQVDAAQENVDHFQALIDFKRIVSPLDGIVTARRLNVGDFINASGADATLGSAEPPFSVGQIDRLRIFVSVPQRYSNDLKPGLQAILHIVGKPGKRITVKFKTTAGAVQQTTRTIVTEFELDNPDGELMPGAYVNAELRLPGDPNLLIIPAQALLFRSQGMQAAVIDDQNHVHLQDVTLGNTLGLNVQITGGLKPDDRIVANPSLGLLEGAQVKIVEPVNGYAPQSTSPSREPLQAKTD